MYVESFKDLRRFPDIKDMADEIKFCQLINHIYERHANVVPLIALGVSELKRDFGNNVTSLPEIHQFLDGFYMRCAPVCATHLWFQLANKPVIK
jgi:pyruvate dehydrogenase kinase 2/3/4